MVPETIIKKSDIDAEEMVRRLRGMTGYLGSRAASQLNNPAQVQKFHRMIRAVENCISEIRNIAPCQWHRTEPAGNTTD